MTTDIDTALAPIRRSLAASDYLDSAAVSERIEAACNKAGKDKAEKPAKAAPKEAPAEAKAPASVDDIFNDDDGL